MKRIMTTMKKVIAIACALFLMAGTATADNGTMILPAHVHTIDEEAFAGTAAKVLVIPEEAVAIESKAFNPADGLTDVYLPKNPLRIADDAFDPDAAIVFHGYMGSNNLQWAKDKQYSTTLITQEAPVPQADAWKQVNDTINTESVSALNDNMFGTSRLILKTNGNEIPALDQFNPKKMIPLGNNLFVIQFHNHNDARACCGALKEWDGCVYAEADYFLSATDTEEEEPISYQAFNAEDPMGFRSYADYLGDNAGNVTIAVIDSGVNEDQVGCTVSSLSFDFINNRYAKSGFATPHGTEVAKKIADCFGPLKNHLTIISYGIENANTGAISYIQMGEALLQAREDGADFVNISIAGESAYSDAQDNEFLRECINLFGSGKVVAAAGNFGVSANRYIPGKYCISVTAVQMMDGILMRAGTATNATYGGYETTTSKAAPMVTAALALVSLDPDQNNKIDNALEAVPTVKKGMPDLNKLAVKLVDTITLTAGYQEVLPLGDNDNIYFSISPQNATNATVNVTSSNTGVIQITNTASNNVRYKAIGTGEAELVFTSADGNAETRATIQVIQYPASVQISGYTDTTLMKGQTMALSATVLPENASDRTVTWTSSNSSIASVSENGIVSQTGSGSVTITARANGDPSVYASVTVTVSDVAPVSGVTITTPNDQHWMTIGRNAGTLQLYATVLPEGTNQAVTWSSSNTSAATIDSNGVVTPKGRGITTITATSVANSSAKGYYDIEVEQLATGLTLSGPTTVSENAEIQLTATVTPSNVNNTEIDWVTSNSGIATVSTSGKVKGISAGTVTITAYSMSDSTAQDSRTITVQPATFTVTYDANGGYCSKTSFTATRGQALGTLTTPTWSYHTFNGWYTAASGGSQVTASTVYDSATNRTIYAHWTENAWSNWETSVPSGATKRDEKTQWRYRDQYTSYSDWSAWGQWLYSAKAITDANLMQEEKATRIWWWAAKCTNCGRHNPHHGSSTKCKKCGRTLANNQGLWATVRYCTETKGTVQTIDDRSDGRYFEGLPYWGPASGPAYRYRTRTVSYPWGSWSSWSDNSVSSSSTRQVETRTLYRYQYP